MSNSSYVPPMKNFKGLIDLGLSFRLFVCSLICYACIRPRMVRDKIWKLYMGFQPEK